MNTFNKLPQELIYIILQYAGELRLLQIKMTRENMYQLINDDKQSYDDDPIIGYAFTIVDRPMRTGATLGYSYYWNMLSVLTAKANCESIQYDIPDDILYKLEEIFINDYNHYYLDDEYYINSIWVNAICYKDLYKDYLHHEMKETKWEVEKYRHQLFHEIEQFVISNNVDK
jgi:hypothetical protein